MNKWLILTGTALCLSLTACGNSPRDEDNTGYYTGYPESGYGNRTDQGNHPTTMNTEEKTSMNDERYRDDGDRREGKERYWFDKIDRDHKGYITRADMRAHAERLFSKMDGNRDGRVTFDEFVEFKRQEAEKHRAYRENHETNY